MTHVSTRPFRSQVGIQDTEVRLWGSRAYVCTWALSEQAFVSIAPARTVLCLLFLFLQGLSHKQKEGRYAEGVRKLIWGIASDLAWCPDELRIAILLGSFLGTIAKTVSQSYVPFCLSHVPSSWGRLKSLRNHWGKGQVFLFYLREMSSHCYSWVKKCMAQPHAAKLAIISITAS